MNIQKGLFKNLLRQAQSQMLVQAQMRNFLVQQQRAAAQFGQKSKEHQAFGEFMVQSVHQKSFSTQSNPSAEKGNTDATPQEETKSILNAMTDIAQWNEIIDSKVPVVF